jgi:hypothetical protein
MLMPLFIPVIFNGYRKHFRESCVRVWSEIEPRTVRFLLVPEPGGSEPEDDSSAFVLQPAVVEDVARDGFVRHNQRGSSKIFIIYDTGNGKEATWLL